MPDLLLKIENLSINIDDKQILNNVSFKVPKGQIITIIGPNGSGKTTIARCILKLIAPQQGNIWSKPGIKIGYMPQKLHLNQQLPLTIGDFLRLKIVHPIDENFLQNIVKEVGIDKILLYPLQKISGGEMQRTLLARALLMNPDLLILDEPTQGVDIHGQAEFYNLIEKLRLEKNIASLIISHDLHMVMKKTDYVICLNHHICCEGSATFVNKQQDFQKLFYNDALMNFAIYEHKHDHHH